ncbi:MAG TPA: family 43 glycosylhydrolase, partial [Armatimonadota bacterium]|nr:family 43 glycosylhydrolase [Armatimonadota bacterium]
MRFADSSRGRPYAKDPAVVSVGEHYYMYYSIPPYLDDRPGNCWVIGIAESRDLAHWEKVGEILPEQPYELNGICAPGAIVLGDTVHLFYQTYGNGPKDALCHATSTDGLHFVRDETNPIFRPTGEWNSGRAIDADVVDFQGKLFLYFATRDPSSTIQQLGVATADLATSFGRSCWTQRSHDAILRPELPWEGECIEAPATIVHDGRVYMFYAGAYNNWPQQIGVAVSDDGIQWTRMSDVPFLPNGKPGEWNSSESGHPYIFAAPDGRTFLFYQGNADNGATWYIASVEIGWNGGRPFII